LDSQQEPQELIYYNNKCNIYKVFYNNMTTINNDTNDTMNILLILKNHNN